MNQFRLISLAFCAAMTGCATNPDVLKQANHGVSLTSELEQELTEFRQYELASEKAMVSTVATQAKAGVGAKAVVTRTDLILKASGDTVALRIVKNLTDLVEGLAALNSEKISGMAEIDKEFSELLGPLPSTVAATTQLQVKFSQLGRELSDKQRKDEFLTHLNTVKKNVKDNKANINAANPAALSSAAN